MKIRFMKPTKRPNIEDCLALVGTSYRKTMDVSMTVPKIVKSVLVILCQGSSVLGAGRKVGVECQNLKPGNLRLLMKKSDVR